MKLKISCANGNHFVQGEMRYIAVDMKLSFCLLKTKLQYLLGNNVMNTAILQEAFI